MKTTHDNIYSKVAVHYPAKTFVVIPKRVPRIHLRTFGRVFRQVGGGCTIMRKTILLTVFVFSTFYGKACDCIMRPIETYLNKVDVVFTGTVIEIVDKVDSSQFVPLYDKYGRLIGKKVKVLVTEKLKSRIVVSDTLVFEYHYSNCEPMYALGESYLFFADKSKLGSFQMTHCTYWGILTESYNNIAKIKETLKE